MKEGIGARSRGNAPAGVVTLAAILVLAGHARAQSTGLYESDRVQRAMKERSLVVDSQPQGKRIGFIEFAREDVFVDDEIWPTWPNLFHTLTRKQVIRRELLFAVGDRYDQRHIEESMRKLRGLDIFALVRIVAVHSTQPGSVGLLVYTRELWSLRLEVGFSGAGAGFNLSLPLTERNLFGRNKQMTVALGLNPKALSVGQEYWDPRLLGGNLQFGEWLAVFVNRDSGHTEGSEGGVTLGAPYRDLSQSWSWNSVVSYSAVVARALRGSDIARYRPKEGGGTEACGVGDPSPPCMRGVWDDRSYRASLSGSYRHGVRYKQTFTLGAGFSDRAVAPNAETQLRPGQEAMFSHLLLPQARRQIYPFAGYGLSLPDFVVFRDLSTYGQSESVREGPSLSADVSVPLQAFGSSSDSVKVHGGAGYVLAGGEALAELSIAAGARLENGHVGDQTLAGVLRGATPSWFAGRFVAYGSWDARRRDTSRTLVMLGGDTGLRGYSAGAFSVVGGSRMRANLEWRTRPLVFESVHLGAVVFYDAGSVYGVLPEATFHHSVGVGLRLLFPQFNHSPFRADFGVPLDSRGFAVIVSYGSQQAVPLTADDDAAEFSTSGP